MNRKIQEMVNRVQSMPDVQAFGLKVARILGAGHPDQIIEVFGEQVFKGWKIIQTHEYKETRNWMRAFSLVFWTERYEGGSDYHWLEYEFMDLMARYWSTDPDFMVHKNTRLFTEETIAMLN